MRIEPVSAAVESLFRYAAVYAGYHGRDHFGKIAVFAVMVDEGPNVHKHETDGDLDAHAPPPDWENFSARKG